uniref:Uncharacterized protein n=1 Tax=Micrurus spixii TaxID=129469 RepID=A0A2D4MGB1_9SAUR
MQVVLDMSISEMQPSFWCTRFWPEAIQWCNEVILIALWQKVFSRSGLVKFIVSITILSQKLDDIIEESLPKLYTYWLLFLQLADKKEASFWPGVIAQNQSSDSEPEEATGITKPRII